jgi:exodeoxyribonuclease V beta subunit
VAVDLDGHRVIEASAGTGKTYTLVELVKKLLTERNASLDQILLVTFTEKAAGELKDRLRVALEDLLRQNRDLRPVLQPALDSFDQAHVYTIHGFCQRVLQEFAFENRHDFRTQPADDRELLEICLRDLQRTRWRAEYGEQLAEILELSGYREARGIESWDSLVMDVAQRYRPACNHKLLPEPDRNLSATLRDLDDRLRAELPRLRSLAGSLDVVLLEDHPWSAGFCQLDHNETHLMARRRDVLLPTIGWLIDPRSREQPTLAFCRLLEQAKKSSTFGDDGFRLLTDGLSNKAQVQLAELCPGLQETVEALEQLRGTSAWEELESQLAVRTVTELQQHLAAYKRERGLLSFEDMLTRLADALDPANPRSPMLLAALRDRFRFAVVDEFQDTDPIQWAIFRRIFVEGGGVQRLFVVGDPKQAIYGFRGADLPAYQAARTALRQEYGAAECTLPTNWRSSPELIDSLNHLFAEGHWFDPIRLDFTRVKPPPPQKRPYQLLSDRTDRAALTLVDVTGPDKVSGARALMARLIAGEIDRLRAGVDGRPALEFQKRGQSAETLSLGHICVLVAKRREADPVLEALRRAKIPYSFYKQPGLWDSAEAVHLGYLLRALVHAGDAGAFAKALMTCFFRIRVEDLGRCEEIAADHRVKRVFQSWSELAAKRSWGALFQAFLDDTGLLFHKREDAETDRRLANFRHIFQTLEQAAYGRDLDLVAILELLEERRRHGDPEADVQPIETDKAKVKVMTIHATKGLEFPVVFLAGGFTQGQSSPYLTYRQGDDLVFDLRTGKGAPGKAAADVERDAEQRRVYYVALTRAMFKLYLPLVDPEKSYAQPGPVVKILAPAVKASHVMDLGRPRAEIARLQAAEGTEATASTPKQPPLAEAKRVIVPPAELFPRLDPQLRRRCIRIRSFSSLHRQAAQQAQAGPSYVEPPPRDDDDVPDVLEGPDVIRGPVFGEMLHDVLEVIDFEQVGQATVPEAFPAQVIDLIGEKRDAHWSKLPLRLSADPARKDSCRAELARLVWTALHTPLARLGGPLWRIPAQDRLHELEFHFPEIPGPPPAEIRRDEGFLTGFMDLVFRKAGKYFLVDWKTNFLTGYSPEEVAQNMRACDYILQYRLYLQALERWLKRVHGGAFQFDRDFGGVYYLYVRGMNGADESTGVFFHKPGPENLRLTRLLPG